MRLGGKSRGCIFLCTQVALSMPRHGKEAKLRHKRLPCHPNSLPSEFPNPSVYSGHYQPLGPLVSNSVQSQLLACWPRREVRPSSVIRLSRLPYTLHSSRRIL